MKKIFLILLTVYVYLMGTPLNIQYTQPSWVMDIQNEKAGTVYFPVDIEYSQLQSLLQGDQYFKIYSVYTSSYSFMPTQRKFYGYVLVYKDSVKYVFVDYGKVESGQIPTNKQKYEFDSYEEFKSFVNNFDIPKNKNWVMDHWVEYMEKIRKNSPYFIKPYGFDNNYFTINLGFGNNNVSSESSNESNTESSSEASSQSSSASSSSSSQASSESSSESDEVESPPSVPVLSSSSDSETLETPPNPPKLEEEQEE